METNQTKPYGQNTNAGSKGKMVTAMFHNREDAEMAYKVLETRGYTKSDVSIIMSDKTRDKNFKNKLATDLGNKAMEGAGTGSAIGGAIGAIVGALAAVGTNLIIPGLGLIIAGPIAAGLAGAGAGGITGGLVGALVGAGIPEDRVKKYEEGIKGGNMVIGVHPRTEDDAVFIEKEWKKLHAEEVYH